MSYSFSIAVLGLQQSRWGYAYVVVLRRAVSTAKWHISSGVVLPQMRTSPQFLSLYHPHPLPGSLHLAYEAQTGLAGMGVSGRMDVVRCECERPKTNAASWQQRQMSFGI